MNCYRIHVLLVIALFVQASVAQSRDALLADARAMREQGRLAEAADLLEGLRVANPDDDEVYAEYGITLARQGDYEAAIAPLENSVLKPGFTRFQPRGLFKLAQACAVWGCDSVAREAIADLQRKYPNSPYATQATLILSDLGDVPQPSADSMWAMEQGAQQQLSEALRGIVRTGTVSEAAEALRLVQESYPGTAAELAALRAQCYVLTRDKARSEDAINHIKNAISIVESSYPDAELRRELHSLVAHMYERLWMPDKQLYHTEILASIAVTPVERAKAERRSVAANVTSLCEQRRLGAEIPAEVWRAAIRRCEQYENLPNIAEDGRRRIYKTRILTALWANDSEYVLNHGEQWLSQYRAVSTAETSKVLYMMGQAYWSQRKYRQASALFEEIISIWPPGTQTFKDPEAPYDPIKDIKEFNLSGAYWLNYLCLLRMPGDNEARLHELADTLRTHYPLSRRVQALDRFGKH